MIKNTSKTGISDWISESEYISLRDEIIQRIILMNSQATNAITVVLTMWAAGLGLFGIQLANLDSFNKLHNLALCFGEVGSFFCAVLILIPMALKSGENLRQQVAISTYIRLFYYDFVRKKRIKSKYIYPWEYMSESTNDIYEKNKRNKRNKVLLSMANAEYPILGLVSVVFSCCVLLAKTAALMRFELERGNVDGFAKLLDYHWELSKKVDAGSSNTLIEQIFSSIEEMIDGRLVCGAGGGGFLQVILKKGITREDVEKRLNEVFMDSLVGVADCKLVW